MLLRLSLSDLNSDFDSAFIDELIFFTKQLTKNFLNETSKYEETKFIPDVIRADYIEALEDEHRTELPGIDILMVWMISCALEIKIIFNDSDNDHISRHKFTPVSGHEWPVIHLFIYRPDNYYSYPILIYDRV